MSYIKISNNPKLRKIQYIILLCTVIFVSGIVIFIKLGFINNVVKSSEISMDKISETIKVSRDHSPSVGVNGLTLTYVSAQSRSYAKGGGATIYNFSLALNDKMGSIHILDTDSQSVTNWEGYTITYISGDKDSFTFNIE